MSPDLDKLPSLEDPWEELCSWLNRGEGIRGACPYQATYGSANEQGGLLRGESLSLCCVHISWLLLRGSDLSERRPVAR